MYVALLNNLCWKDERDTAHPGGAHVGVHFVNIDLGWITNSVPYTDPVEVPEIPIASYQSHESWYSDAGGSSIHSFIHSLSHSANLSWISIMF